MPAKKAEPKQVNDSEPKMVNCEVVRKIFIDNGKGNGGTIAVAPNKLTDEELTKNIQLRLAGKEEDQIEPKPVYQELDVETAKKLQKAGAVRVAI